jgi:hypothetical protein
MDAPQNDEPTPNEVLKRSYADVNSVDRGTSDAAAGALVDLKTFGSKIVGVRQEATSRDGMPVEADDVAEDLARQDVPLPKRDDSDGLSINLHGDIVGDSKLDQGVLLEKEGRELIFTRPSSVVRSATLVNIAAEHEDRDEVMPLPRSFSKKKAASGSVLSFAKSSFSTRKQLAVSVPGDARLEQAGVMLQQFKESRRKEVASRCGAVTAFGHLSAKAGVFMFFAGVSVLFIRTTPEVLHSEAYCYLLGLGMGLVGFSFVLGSIGFFVVSSVRFCIL